MGIKKMDYPENWQDEEKQSKQKKKNSTICVGHHKQTHIM